MEVLEYFNPVDSAILNDSDFFIKKSFGTGIHVNKENFKPKRSQYKIAIIGVPEERGSFNTGCAQAPDAIREQLYKLARVTTKNNSIIDLGNLKPGQTYNDTCFGLKDVILELNEVGTAVVIIGGSQVLNYGAYMAFEHTKQQMSMVNIDSRFDLGDIQEPLNPLNHVGKVISAKSKYLFNYINIGYQAYYSSKEEIDLMKNLLFDYYRLGLVQANLLEVEPAIREASMVSFDISAIRQSDAPGHKYPSCNGMFGQEACQLARYAGLAERVSVFGLYDVNPQYDNNNQTSQLAAQILWHFMEGFFHRKNDYPYKSIKECKKIVVSMQHEGYDIVFYNNPKTCRWWMEVPHKKSNYEKNLIVSCSQRDFEIARHGDVPDRWWKYFQKIN